MRFEARAGSTLRDELRKLGYEVTRVGEPPASSRTRPSK
jgi:hypothetical protein